MQLGNTQVEEIFISTFSESYKTILIGGFSEPEYLPAGSVQPAKIQYRADYVESSLHEAAHWCLAGEKRRKLNDYGYWYSPDGRDKNQQQKFFEVEVKPQALEWIISSAAGVSFKPSVDNLHLDPQSLERMTADFIKKMKAQAISYLNEELFLGDLSHRALRFAMALKDASGSELVTAEQIHEAVF